jgi:hypothetical protein
MVVSRSEQEESKMSMSFDVNGCVEPWHSLIGFAHGPFEWIGTTNYVALSYLACCCIISPFLAGFFAVLEDRFQHQSGGLLRLSLSS